MAISLCIHAFICVTLLAAHQTLYPCFVAGLKYRTVVAAVAHCLVKYAVEVGACCCMLVGRGTSGGPRALWHADRGPRDVSRTGHLCGRRCTANHRVRWPYEAARGRGSTSDMMR